MSRMLKFAQTDVGNAEMFASISSDDLRYDHKRGRCHEAPIGPNRSRREREAEVTLIGSHRS